MLSDTPLASNPTIVLLDRFGDELAKREIQLQGGASTSPFVVEVSVIHRHRS
jgi:hypothetical protein